MSYTTIRNSWSHTLTSVSEWEGEDSTGEAEFDMGFDLASPCQCTSLR